MTTWKLIALCEAKTSREAAAKFTNKLPYMLVNDVDKDGSVSLWIEETHDKPKRYSK